MAKNKNEDFQSRRDFFKKAGKGILPVLGIMMLSNIPGIVTAAEKTQGGCDSSCESTCSGGCLTGCHTGCEDGCRGGCTNSCKSSCEGSSK